LHGGHLGRLHHASFQPSRREFFLGGKEEVLVERIGMNGHTHLPPPEMIERLLTVTRLLAISLFSASP
jgi:hypothetical protein